MKIKNIVVHFDALWRNNKHATPGILFPKELENVVGILREKEIRVFIISTSKSVIEMKTSLEDAKIKHIIEKVEFISIGIDHKMPEIPTIAHGLWELKVLYALIALKLNVLETVWMDTQIVPAAKKAGFQPFLVLDAPLDAAYLTALPKLIENPNNFKQLNKIYEQFFLDTKVLEDFYRQHSKDYSQGGAQEGALSKNEHQNDRKAYNFL